MKTLYLSLFLLLLVASTTKAQKFVEVLNKTITLASHSNVDPENYTQLSFPVMIPNGAIGYIYRVSLHKKEAAKPADKLIDQLKTIPDAERKLTADFSQFTRKNTNEGKIDFFIFTSERESSIFHSQDDKGWKSCKEFWKSEGGCFASDECMSSKIWFGLRNNSLTKGQEVYLEIAALVDEDQAIIAQSMNTYKITNGTTSTMSFQLSTDGQNWTNYSLETKASSDFNFNESQIFFKMTPQAGQPLQYKLDPTTKYKIQFNATKQSVELAGYR